MTDKELEAQLDKLEQRVNSNGCSLRYALATAALLGARYAAALCNDNAISGGGGAAVTWRNRDAGGGI